MTVQTVYVNAAKSDETADVIKGLELLLRQVAISQGGLGKFDVVLHDNIEDAEEDDPHGHVIAITVDDRR